MELTRLRELAAAVGVIGSVVAGCPTAATTPLQHVTPHVAFALRSRHGPIGFCLSVHDAGLCK